VVAARVVVVVMLDMPVALVAAVEATMLVAQAVLALQVKDLPEGHKLPVTMVQEVAAAAVLLVLPPVPASLAAQAESDIIPLFLVHLQQSSPGQ
jgi:hypothetical protein